MKVDPSYRTGVDLTDQRRWVVEDAFRVAAQFRRLVTRWERARNGLFAERTDGVQIAPLPSNLKCGF